MSNKDCQDRRETIAAFVLEELEGPAADEIRRHIGTCRECRLLYHALIEEEEIVRSAFEAIDERSKALQNTLIARADSGLPKSVSRLDPLRQMWHGPKTTKRMTRLATAAVIAIAFVGGTTFWPSRSTDGKQWWLTPPAAWSQEIMAALDTFNSVTCREQTVDVMPDGSKHTSSTWDILYVSSDSYRRDIYDGGVLREIQWYVPDGNATLHHSVRFDLKSYFTHSGEGSFGDYGPVERMRSIVRRLDKADKLLGEKVIEGRDCVGFEISANKYGDNPEEWIDAIWFDVDTKLPVCIEKRGRSVSGQEGETRTRIQDQFDYDPGLSADTFVPNTPEGFIYGHPDEIRAAREKQQKE